LYFIGPAHYLQFGLAVLLQFASTLVEVKNFIIEKDLKKPLLTLQLFYCDFTQALFNSSVKAKVVM
jgi:hypothetical protein